MIDYSRDKREYNLINNVDFFNWLKTTIDDGYKLFVDLRELQKLIDEIALFYETSYKDEMIKQSGLNYEDTKRSCECLDITKLLNRLSTKQQDFLNCIYRHGTYIQAYNYEDGDFKRIEKLYLSIYKKSEEHSCADERPYFYICIDFNTGRILKSSEDKYFDVDIETNIERLLDVLENNYSDVLDYTELKECVYNNYCDIELRHRILELVSLKLLYSKNVTPDEGYEIAKRFIKDFSEKFGLILSTEKIDAAFNKKASVK